MTSNLDKMKEIIASDKRACDRLELPLKIRYARLTEEESEPVVWSEYVWLDNVAGEGLGFAENVEFRQGEKLDIELQLPNQGQSFYFGAEVVRIVQNDDAKETACKAKYYYGLKIYRLSENDRKKFEQFISDSIIDRYLDDQGELRDDDKR